MTAPYADVFLGIAFTLFVAELTDKDAFLLLTLATRERAVTVFLAGATAFVVTTTLFVSTGTLIVAAVPLLWVRLCGGSFMLAYALWQFRRAIRGRAAAEAGIRDGNGRRPNSLKTFFAFVGALALLDLAGDATEVLTIVFAAQYSNASLVFPAACTGLIAATALETTLGNRVGRVLTPRRLLYFSTAVLFVLGAWIIATGIRSP